MPFKSEAQRKWMHANHPEMAKEWEAETGDSKLPDHVVDDQTRYRHPKPQKHSKPARRGRSHG